MESLETLTEELPEVVSHPVLLVLLVPFIIVFGWAAVLEIRRWWRYGPSLNQRSRFPINESAPGYEPTPQDDDSAGPPRPAGHKTRRTT